MLNTTNLNLKKPGLTDYANIEDINDNMDTIDGAIKTLQTEVEAAPTNVEMTTELDKKVNLLGGTMTGILKAQTNTAYTTLQVRNIILSPGDANNSLMQNGEIWVKYK